MTEFIPHPHQPISTEIKMLDGVFVKSMCIAKAGTFIPQHSHTFDHVSVLVRGSVRVQTGGNSHSIAYRAPAGIMIPAGVKHLFESLEDDTIVLCVHDIRDGEGVSIEVEHHLIEPDALGG
jgi:quercetin dioxygenase-like cupin family protein